jgi:cytochrome c oxidase subunit 4
MSDHVTHEDAHGHEDHGVGHVVHPKILIGTALALVILTVITVVAAQVDWAQWDMPEVNIWVAMSIAAVKASLVCLFFMHLFWDRPFNSIVLVCSIGFVAIFIAFALTDTVEYRHDIIEGDGVEVQQRLQQLADLEAHAAEGGDDAH